MNRTAITTATLVATLAVFAGCSAPTGSDTSGGGGGGGSESRPSEEAATTLVITEVGSSPYVNISTWFEIYNTGSDPVELDDIDLRTTVKERTSPYSDTGEALIQLPSLSIPPGGYALIRGRISDTYVTAGRVAYVKTGSNEVPNWYGSGGFLELLAGGKTVDFVRFGDSTTEPTSTSAWGSGSAAALPTGSDSYGYAIARDASNTDTNSAADWSYREFATPGGPNDVTTTADADGDGIPDANETPGSTFAGLPLYQWGARQGTPDVFIHVNYMDISDAGVIPRKAALDAVVSAFAKEGINLHLDVGDLFDNASGTDPDEYDLSDTSHRVPFAQSVAMGEYAGYANLYEYKYDHMPLARKQVFHYALFGFSQEPDGSAGSSGRAEIYGNDFMVTLGNWGLTDGGSSEELNILENFQASTFMHEFGHNLGLRHGGDEDQNYKPNYFSIMNYLYQLRFLPDIGTADAEGDRYYLEYGHTGYQNIDDIHRNPYDYSPAIVNMNYSHGAGSDIDETNVSESIGLGQPGGAAVDYNDNGTSGDHLGQYNLNASWGTGKSVISDYDDWANIELFFGRTYYGDSSGMLSPLSSDSLTMQDDPVWDDRQQVYPETAPTEIIEWLKERQ